MDSYPDVQEHESCAKRIKLDLDESNLGELCKGEGFSCFSTSSTGPIDITEGISADCDSGYEASNLESVPTPLHTFPRTDPGDIQETMSSISESFMQTPTHADQQDTSQDSVIEDDDDNASTVSELSGLSDLSGQDWKPMAGSMIWIQQQMQKGVNPREILSELGVDSQIPEYVDDIAIWKLIINMLSEPPRRNKLRHINTLDDVVRLLKGAQNIIVLTGAGVSVSCGIPDFRSRDGIYSRLAIDFPNLPDPQAMFDISYFSQDPRPFFKFARDIYPGKFQPSPCHRFIKLLEKQKKLLRNYTQNIDTLEKEAKIDKVIECHGSFATATCTKCGHKVTAEKIRDHVLAQKIPLCEVCHPGQECSVSTDDVRASQANTNYRELVESGQAFSKDRLFTADLFYNFSLFLCRLGNHWEEGIYSSQTLQHAETLLPLENPLLPELDKQPIPSIDFSYSHQSVSSHCICKSTNSSSLSADVTTETQCLCFTYKSINDSELESKSGKERHMSIDSAKDSGIGENSNFTDKYESDENGEEKSATSFCLEICNDSSTSSEGFRKSSSDLRGYWQPKVKKSLADRLPENSFHL
uniref:protein acetyllysine N-acetyltransferase n=1 Tax=Diabrotica virgifera virgifera TaxID=50390 RepID=A0A6P7GF80_DIAVI